jgi:hypothetical protein
MMHLQSLAVAGIQQIMLASNIRKSAHTKLYRKISDKTHK